MTSDLPALSQGDEYVAHFHGGPYDGQTEHRVSTDGSWPEQIMQIVNESAIDAELRYTAGNARDAGGTVLVDYTYSPEGSEGFIDPAERYDS
jgi:hypothetical protein